MPSLKPPALFWIALVGLIAIWTAGHIMPDPQEHPAEASPPAASSSTPTESVDARSPDVPILLVYGFQPLPGFHPPDLWRDVIEALTGGDSGDPQKHSPASDHSLYAVTPGDASERAIYVSDYALSFEPTVRDLRFYAQRLSEEIAWIASAEGVESLDVITFSMGALVARCYIEAADFRDVLGEPGFEDYGTAYRGDVRTLITIAAPHHGAAFAALGPWFGPLPTQLDPESAFFALLNRGESEGQGLHPDVRYVSLAGQCCLGFGCSVRSDVDACRRECVEEALAWSGHDLVILMTSARLSGAENVACIGFDHVDMRTHPVISEALQRILEGEDAPDALFADEALRAASP
jgi:hypothetical protein